MLAVRGVVVVSPAMSRTPESGPACSGWLLNLCTAILACKAFGPLNSQRPIPVLSAPLGTILRLTAAALGTQHDQPATMRILARPAITQNPAHGDSQIETV